MIEDIRYISNELYNGSNEYKSKGWSYCWCLNSDGKVAIALKRDMIVLEWLNSWRDVESFIDRHQGESSTGKAVVIESVL